MSTQFKTWQCIKCTLINREYYTKCEVCESPKIPRVNSKPTKKLILRNNTLTDDTKILNTAVDIASPGAEKIVEAVLDRNLHLEMHGSTAEKNLELANTTIKCSNPIAADDPTKSEWNCSACTLINSVSRFSCKLCDTPKSQTTKPDPIPSTRSNLHVKLDGNNFHGDAKIANVSITGPGVTSGAVQGLFRQNQDITISNTTIGGKAEFGCVTVKTTTLASSPASEWICEECTLANEELHQICIACQSPKRQIAKGRSAGEHVADSMRLFGPGAKKKICVSNVAATGGSMKIGTTEVYHTTHKVIDKSTTNEYKSCNVFNGPVTANNADFSTNKKVTYRTPDQSKKQDS
eukprot:TRINITY_DN14876_c0_g1_i1.p1 TRINITY_DN14876_c0_g1~~TRINITY_DN14876_c0_g1_i1.p1  ORF type:complete len:391 (+),score=34.90 TRINITY_DN14876_c0_g1_i1:127-1173(+)